MTFEFTPNKVDDHIEKIGVHIRPAIEPKLDRDKLFQFGKNLADKFPKLFESLVQSTSDFHIRKKFIFSGKGEADQVTLGISDQGISFIIPRRIHVFDEETDLGRSEEIVIESLKVFKQHFPIQKILRVGQVNDYIYNIGPNDSFDLIANKFANLNSKPTEIRLRVNYPNDDYNRIIELEALKQIQSTTEISDLPQVSGYGVKVTVDFNNRDMTKELKDNDILLILHKAQEYNKKELYEFLNR